MAKIVAFGEILLRLTPQESARLTEAAGFDGCYGGSEANVAIALSCQEYEEDGEKHGDDISYITVLPDNAIGTAAIRNLNRYGVDTGHIVKEGDILGSYFVEEGFGDMGSSVIYNRRFSEIARMKEHKSHFTKQKIKQMLRGADLFHISGISYGVSEDCRKVCEIFVECARELEIPVSFDFNYRGKLWTEAEAAKCYREIAPKVDIIFLSDKDIENFLCRGDDIFGGETKDGITSTVGVNANAGTDGTVCVNVNANAGTDGTVCVNVNANAGTNGTASVNVKPADMTEQEIETYIKDILLKKNGAKYVLRRNRGKTVNGVQKSTAKIYCASHDSGNIIETKTYEEEYQILDRVGSGDAFCAGALHGILHGMNEDEIVEYAMGAFVMKHCIKGDIITKTSKEISCFIQTRKDSSNKGDIKR